MRALLLIGGIVACTGEQVQSPAISDTGSETSSTTCAEVMGTKLVNGSFETWVADNATKWTYEGLVPKRRDTGAADCQSWLEVSRSCFASVRQTVTFPTALAKGTSVRAGVSTKFISGDPSDEVTIEILFDGEESSSGTINLINGDGSWDEMGVERTVDVPTKTATFVIGFDDCAKQTVGFDRAWMTVQTF